MNSSTQPGFGRASLLRDELEGIRRNMAMAMIGRTVKLLVDARTIALGVVTGVTLANARTPKLVVGGARYDMSQVLTVTPSSINLLN